MKVLTLTAAIVLLGTSYALAGPGAGQPRQPADPSSGRPTAILDDAQCSDVWSAAQPSGDGLSEGQAAPYIVNFDLVDGNKDGKITEVEFKEGCKQGLVQKAEAPQQPSGQSVPQSDTPVQQDLMPDAGSSTDADTNMPQ
jgi:hypothetical protein